MYVRSSIYLMLIPSKPPKLPLFSSFLIGNHGCRLRVRSAMMTLYRSSQMRKYQQTLNCKRPKTLSALPLRSCNTQQLLRATAKEYMVTRNTKDTLLKLKQKNKNCIIVQELCESRGGRPGLPVLMSLTVSVDVKQHGTMHTHW